MKAFALAPLLLLALLPACRREREAGRMAGAPSRVLWAWESPQDLRFLEPGTGVAFLAGELHLEAEPRWVGRRQPLRLRPDTWRMAVLRVECRRVAPGEAEREAFLDRALAAAALPGVRALQVDFDARAGERAWYREALLRLRARLPEATPLSITALASWCWEDPWLATLPVDEAVPMLFRMGRGDGAIRRRLADGEAPSARPARNSLGVSTDEALPRLPSGLRVYVFHPGPWSASAWEHVRAQLP